MDAIERHPRRSILKWRATLTVAAKTAKEYQAAAVAWLNWLVQIGSLAVNPLGKLPAVATRGKQVRIARALTVEELTALFAVATPERRLVYQVLAYTGQRRAEVRSLVRGDLHLDGDRPHALFRAETMKDREKRAVPLHPELAAVLRVAGRRMSRMIASCLRPSRNGRCCCAIWSG